MAIPINCVTPNGALFTRYCRILLGQGLVGGSYWGISVTKFIDVGDVDIDKAKHLLNGNDLEYSSFWLLVFVDVFFRDIRVFKNADRK